MEYAVGCEYNRGQSMKPLEGSGAIRGCTLGASSGLTWGDTDQAAEVAHKCREGKPEM
jgi:hypothetical protein